MSSNDVMNGPVAVLNAPRANAALIVYLRSIDAAMTGNAAVPNPPIALTTFADDIAAYESSETVASTRAKGSSKARDIAKRTVLLDARHLRAYVQSVADSQASVAAAAAVITGAGFGVKTWTRHNKPPLVAKDGSVAGTAALVAKAIAKDTTYFWQFSVDAKNWSNAPETMKCTTVISGLTSGQTYYFRFRALTRAGAVDYCQPVSLLVR